jgi:heme/copper-type cytochrome/quinol oxidase subunit 4
MILTAPSFNYPALFTIDVTSKFGSEYIIMFEDICRMILIQITIQLMFYMSMPERQFLSDEFILLVLYIILGVCLYWLVFKNIIKFV